MNKVAIIGGILFSFLFSFIGGPVGLYLSLVLAKEGYKVDVFEKRDQVRDESHAIGLALSARGIYALSQIDMDINDLKI